MTKEELIDLADKTREVYPDWMQWLDFQTMNLYIHKPSEKNETWVRVQKEEKV